jgi:hypothetical protein
VASRSFDPTAGEPRAAVKAEIGSVVDYALVRRATLADLRNGRVTPADVCDAHPYLLRAARFHGEPTEVRCPVCRHPDPLTHVTYVYGDRLGEASGRPLRAHQLERVAAAHGPVTAYVVEVCGHCSWNHLVSSHVRGSVEPMSENAPKNEPSRRRAAGR